MRTLLLILALVILLRLPSLVDPKYYLDEGVYASVAHELSQGGTLYKTAWDLKPPGIFYVYLFFQKVFGAHAFLAQRIFNTLLAALTVFGIFRLALLQRLTEPRSVTALTSAVLATVYLGLPFFETQIFNTENIFVVTSLFAFIFGLKFKDRWREPLIAGFLFGVGQWLKIHPVFDLAAFGIFALYKFRLDKKFWLPFVAGLATPIVGLFLYLVTNGILTNFIETNLSYNLFYVEELPQITIFGNLLMRTLLLVIVTTALIFLKSKNKISENTFLLSLWFAFTFYGALLSARAYGHYFIPTLIPLSPLLASLSAKASPLIRRGLQNVVVIALIFLPFVGFLLLQSPHRIKTFRQKIFDEQLNYYQIRLSYMLGKMSPRQFESHFTPKPYRLRELKKYLDENARAGEQVYLWGNSPWAPYVLQRRPAQRFLMWFHVLGIKEREEEVYQDLLSRMPEVIIVEDSEISRPPFPKLQDFVDINYKFETNIAGYNIYRLITLAVIHWSCDGGCS